MTTFPHSNLGAWIGRLRQADPSLTLTDSLNEIDRVSLDNAVGFAAEHARRYVATDGADDGWDGPRPILVLYSTGRRSGAIRRNPLLYFEHEGERYLIGSKGGDSRHPEWYLNLVAEPRVHLRVGAEVYEADARTLDDGERAALWPDLVAAYPMFDDYQQATTRRIPVVHLLRRRTPAEIMTTYLTDVVQGGRLDLIGELAQPDMVDEANQAFGGPPGRDGLVAHVVGFRRNVGEIDLTIDRMVAGEGEVMGWWSFTGTLVGPWLGRTPHGGPISGTAFSFFELIDGKISRYRVWLHALLPDPVVFDSSRPVLPDRA